LQKLSQKVYCHVFYATQCIVDWRKMVAEGGGCSAPCKKGGNVWIPSLRVGIAIRAPDSSHVGRESTMSVSRHVVYSPMHHMLLTTASTSRCKLCGIELAARDGRCRRVIKTGILYTTRTNHPVD